MKPNASMWIMLAALALLGVCAACHVSEQSTFVVAGLAVIGVGLRDQARWIFPTAREATKVETPDEGGKPSGVPVPAGGEHAEIVKELDEAVKLLDGASSQIVNALDQIGRAKKAAALPQEKGV